LELILSESDRITRLIDKLSAFELFSNPKLLPCNIHQILEQVIRAEEVVFGKSVAFARNFDPSLPEIEVDADHLHEAFQNIIRNAAEAVRDYALGDRVGISTRFSLGRQSKSGERTDVFRAIKVSIEDNGPGITKKDQKAIFEMFRTSKANGSGLGLTVANQVIEAHAGQVEVVSQAGGATFNIYLPITRAS
jgi:two-component system nitrogen regulation sensor histidine kinase GlnL